MHVPKGIIGSCHSKRLLSLPLGWGHTWWGVSPSPSLLTPALASSAGRKECPVIPLPRPLFLCPKHKDRLWFQATLFRRRGGLPQAFCPLCLPVVTGRGNLLCWCLFSAVVSSDSDSDSDLSSSSLEDRLLLTGVREPKGAKPCGEAGKQSKDAACS